MQNSTPAFLNLCELIDFDDKVERIVVAVRDAYELTHVTFQLAQTVSSSAVMPYVRTTYPAEWVSRYLLKGYVNLDPVVAAGFERFLPFDWTEIQITPAAAALLQESKDYGLGQSGFSIPIIDKSGRRSLFSANSVLTGCAWRSVPEQHQHEWVKLAHLLHRKAIEEIYGNQDPAPQLGPRELECLQWVAQGKDYKDIAIILQISEHTARSYLKSARHKLNCANLSQAASRAIKLGMI